MRDSIYAASRTARARDEDVADFDPECRKAMCLGRLERVSLAEFCNAGCQGSVKHTPPTWDLAVFDTRRALIDDHRQESLSQMLL